MSALILVAFMVGPVQLPAAPAQGQAIYKTVRVEGQVLATDGSPLPGATVSTALVNTSTTVTTVTNAEGRYVLPEVRIINGELNLFFNAIDGSITENNIRSMGLTLNASFSVTF